MNTALTKHQLDNPIKDFLINSGDFELILQNSKSPLMFRNYVQLTSPYKDLVGREIQLWKSDEFGLFGTILDVNDILFIPKFRIRSVIGGLEGDSLLEKLEQAPNKQWNLIYLVKKQIIILWPHLEAGGRLGREGPNGQFKHGDGLDGNRKNIFKPGTLQDAKREAEGGKPLIWQKKKEGGEKYNHKAGQPIEHLTKVRQEQRSLKKTIETEQKKLNSNKLTPEQRQKSESLLGAASKLLQYTKKYVPYKTGLFSNSPAKNQYQETVQKTGLTKSYNSCNPDNQIAKGGGKQGDRRGWLHCRTD